MWTIVSFSTLIKTTVTSTQFIFSLWRDASWYNNECIFKIDTTLIFEEHDWTTNYIVDSWVNVSDWKYHLIWFVKNWNIVNIYIDNKLVKTQTTTTIDYAARWSFIWYNWRDNNYYFNWNIWIARLYNRVLSEDEIRTLYLEWLQKLSPSRVSYPELFKWCIAYFDFKNWDLSNLVDGSLATNNWATLTTDHFWYGNSAYSFNWADWYYMDLWTHIDWACNTYTVWWLYKINSADQYWIMLSQWTTTDSTNKFNLEVESWNIKFIIHNTSWTWYAVSDTASDWQWHFFIWTFDGSNVKFYKDWILLWTTSFSWTPVNTNDNMRISAYSNNTSYNINWDVSVIFAFERVLSDEEIKLLYNLLMK